MTVLPGELPGLMFEVFRASLEAAPPHPHWRLKYIAFPYAALEVLNSQGKPIVGVLIDARDWPHRPPSATPCSLDFRQRFAVKDCAAFIPKEAGENHIWDSARRLGQGAYFCVEGTREFHEDYGDALPWEAVRHLPNFSPVAIINNVVSILKRD